MRPIVAPLLGVALLATTSRYADASDGPSPARTYELMINGESFLIDLDRHTKLQSKENPGTTYHVALRVSPRQRVELNAMRFTYELPATLSDDRGRRERVARVQHEAGYTMLLTDLGGTIEARDQAVAVVSESVAESLRDSGAKDVTVGKPIDRKFAHCEAKVVAIRFQDRHGFPETCAVYLLTAPKFAATCVVQFFDKDAEKVLPKVQETLDSVQAAR